MWNLAVDFVLGFAVSGTALLLLGKPGRLLLIAARRITTLGLLVGASLNLAAYRPEGWLAVAMDLVEPLLALPLGTLCSIAGAASAAILVQLIEVKRRRK